MRLIERCPTSVRLLENYKIPNMLAKVEKYGTFCVTNEKSPTLAVVAETYGNNVVTTWLMGFINNLCKSKNICIDGEQETELAKAWSMNFYYLRMSEFEYFYARCMAGAYGVSYGLDNVSVLSDWLQAYTKERLEIFASHQKMVERAKAEKLRREIDEQSISIADHLKTLGPDYAVPSSVKTLYRDFMTNDYEDLRAVDALKVTDTPKNANEGQNS